MSILEKFSYPGMIRACCKQFPKPTTSGSGGGSCEYMSYSFDVDLGPNESSYFPMHPSVPPGQDSVAWGVSVNAEVHSVDVHNQWGYLGNSNDNAGYFGWFWETVPGAIDASTGQTFDSPVPIIAPPQYPTELRNTRNEGVTVSVVFVTIPSDCAQLAPP